MERYAKVLEGAGSTPERFRWKEISAAECFILAKTMREMFQQLEDIGIDKTKEENERARKRISAPLKRKGFIPEEQGTILDCKKGGVLSRAPFSSH